MKTLYLFQKTVQLIVFTLLFSMQSFASKTDSLATKAPQTEEVMTNSMINRLEEIKKIDKSNMTRLEKKALRKEVKSIKAKLQTTSRGVYLSVGAIIIIILLLILLL
jgi:predicted PurR-regulated permease PerM